MSCFQGGRQNLLADFAHARIAAAFCALGNVVQDVLKPNLGIEFWRRWFNASAGCAVVKFAGILPVGINETTEQQANLEIDIEPIACWGQWRYAGKSCKIGTVDFGRMPHHFANVPTAGRIDQVA
ncbi:MAG TPA: hypothetical protein VHY91_12970 [Pirellulales bacterium]|nr:hypothetical protein [Pirellulales bacterium]